MEKDNRLRFSNKAEDYVKYRPSYPEELLKFLTEKLDTSTNTIVADIGSGTGISSALFVTNGNTVFGVEPNLAMRQASEKMYAAAHNFNSIDGSGEQTNLATGSIDLIFSGQAFHWFDKPKAKKEFSRILQPNGHIVLTWNIIDETNPVGYGYQQLLKQHIKGYTDLQQNKIDEAEIEAFFSPSPVNKTVLNNYQQLDLRGFTGRIRSSSLVPNEGEIYETIVTAIEKLFHEYAINGAIKFGYQTYVYWC